MSRRSQFRRFSENRGTGKRLRPRAPPELVCFLIRALPWIVRKALCLLFLLLAACGGAPTGPSESPAPSNPESRVPSPGQSSDSRVQLTDDFGGRQLFPADNWWNQDISTRAGRSAVGRLHRLHRTDARRCIPTSVRRRTAFRTSASAAASRACRSRSSTTAARAIAGFRGETRLSDSRRGEDAAELHRRRRGGRRATAIATCSSSIAIAGCCSNCSPRGGTRRASDGRRDRARCSIFVERAAAEGWTSADAAGLAILPGLVRYDEAVRGPIRHAFRVTVRSDQRLRVARLASRGQHAGALPMGARLRLKASKDLSRYPAYIQNIFRAMQTYGLIVADNGTDMYVTGAMDARWNNGELNPAFRASPPATSR